MKNCPFCAGVIPDASTICKHCKQSIPSARASAGRKMPAWALVAFVGVLIAAGAPAVLWMRPGSQAGAASEEGRRAQVVAGLQAAQVIATQKTQCESPTAVADAWRQLKMVRRDDPDFEHAHKMVEQLETCRAGIASALAGSVSELRRQQRLNHAETVRRGLQTQGFDTTVALGGAEKDEILITSPQLNAAQLDRVTTNLSMTSGSFLESWQRLGCSRVTFSNGKHKWAYDLPRSLEAFQDVSVLTGMGLGTPLALP